MVEEHILVGISKPHIESEVDLLQHEVIRHFTDMVAGLLQSLSQSLVLSKRKFGQLGAHQHVLRLNEVSIVKINSDDVSVQVYVL